MIELCARCGKPTPYPVETPITLRRYFVEGAGQLCPQCFRKLYGENEPFLSLYERGCGRLLTKDEDCPKQAKALRLFLLVHPRRGAPIGSGASRCFYVTGKSVARGCKKSTADYFRRAGFLLISISLFDGLRFAQRRPRVAVQ